MNLKKHLGKVVKVMEYRDNGIAVGVIKKISVNGKITSVRGMSRHTNVHKYEITTECSKHYRNSLKLKS